MKAVRRMIILVAAMLVAAAAAIIAYNAAVNSRGPEVEAISVNLSGSVNDIGQLVTAEYGYTMAQTANKPHTEVAGFKIPFTDSKVIYSYEGLIKAGVDFSQIVIDVDDTAKKVKITLPEPQIMSSEVDRDSLIVYDEKYSPFNVFTFEDMSLSVAELQKAAEENALSKGLMERAAENAKTLLTSTVGNFYDLEEYGVEFQ